MDWQALTLSLSLGAWTVAILLPVGIVIGRYLAWTTTRGKGAFESLLALPLVLPPTVLGYYLLVSMSGQSPLGGAFQAVFGQTLVFSFEGLVVASVIANLPFAIQPMQRAFEAIPREVREAAECCGLSRWQVLRRIELPLAWPGILTGIVLTFTHTLGEFGVVLMVGGSIPGETKTIAIAIYDRVQAFDDDAAARMAALLLALSFITIAVSYVFTNRRRRHF
ncbi:MAG: molybdate ABC transporter permease subunit [Rhodospirillaceae bacterium]